VLLVLLLRVRVRVHSYRACADFSSTHSLCVWLRGLLPVSNGEQGMGGPTADALAMALPRCAKLKRVLFHRCGYSEAAGARLRAAVEAARVTWGTC
jgi:hypothetical protein